MKKKTTQPTIADQLHAREKLVNETFVEIVKTIDEYMHVAPVVFIEGDEAHPGQHIFREQTYRFSKFDAWLERWMGALYPNTLECQQKIEDGHGSDDVYMDLAYDVKRFSYLLGYLMGCRSMGASTDELLIKAKGFTADDLGHRRWRLENP